MLTDGNVSTTPAAVIDLSALFEGPFIDYDVVKSVLKAIDLITVVYFCIEYIVRFVCSPDKKKFFFQVTFYCCCRKYISLSNFDHIREEKL